MMMVRQRVLQLFQSFNNGELMKAMGGREEEEV
jgi:hypothetical protein